MYVFILPFDKQLLSMYHVSIPGNPEFKKKNCAVKKHIGRKEERRRDIQANNYSTIDP